MADGEPSRPRARSEATRIRGLATQGLHRRSTGGPSRQARSGRVPSLTSRATMAERTQGQFTLAGSEETTQHQMAHEPFVHPGYTELNPEYEQGPNAKPVWSLTKPLPRVERPGMVPTKQELLQSRAKPQLPAEKSQKLGLDVDLNELEEGRTAKTVDPARWRRRLMMRVRSGRITLPGDKQGGLTDFTEVDESAYPEDLHPLIQGLVEDEVHNNTQSAVAESLAVFIQLVVGLSADLSVTLPSTTNPNTTAWAWAPTSIPQSRMLWFYRGFPKRKMPEYFAAQFIGAFVAALAVYALYYHSITEYLSFSTNFTTEIMNSFVTSQRNPWIGPATAFFNEFLGIVVLSITLLALGDDQNAPPGAGMNALIVGLTIYCLSLTFSYQTGAAFNPSRDFSPRLALLALGYRRGLFANPYWFYGPTQRAMRKSCMKWEARLRSTKREIEKIAT
ncbi:aquaporin-like protein [Aspergillus cavernicola]|uniref:Aquaporin-like protein n=1 Tax=Aspergillus cavernicola TaxID=176166 RepID=A0ABR4HRR5_9EURO